MDEHQLFQSSTLDLDNPIEAAVHELVVLQRRKGADYAEDRDWASNFRRVADHFGQEPVMAAEFMLMSKLERLRALRLNNREPFNEAVVDTYRDAAVYALIAYALFAERMNVAKPIGNPALPLNTEGSSATGITKTPPDEWSEKRGLNRCIHCNGADGAHYLDCKIANWNRDAAAKQLTTDLR